MPVFGVPNTPCNKDGNAFEYYQYNHSTWMVMPLNIISITKMVLLIIFKGVSIRVEWVFFGFFN